MSVCCYLAPNPIPSVVAGDRAVVPRPEAALARPWHALPEAATCGADLQDAASADCGSQDGTSPKGSPRPPRRCLRRRVHTRERAPGHIADLVGVACWLVCGGRDARSANSERPAAVT